MQTEVAPKLTEDVLEVFQARRADDRRGDACVCKPMIDQRRPHASHGTK